MRYEWDFVVVGGGAAGLTGSGVAAMAGARTLLVEAGRLGGECTWTGCIPSKTLQRVSREAAVSASNGKSLSSGVGEAALHEVRRVREAIYARSDSPERLASFGIEVLHATARFRDAHRLAVTSPGYSRIVSSRWVLLASGSSPCRPPGIPSDHRIHTSDTIFELESVPERLLVVGAGPTGLEIGQAFARLGSVVTIVEKGGYPLGSCPRSAGEFILRHLIETDGIRFYTDSEVARVETNSDALDVVIQSVDGEAHIQASHILLATGRRPRVLDLGLDEAGVVHGEDGIRVDAFGRTSRRHIYAAGDVTGKHFLTHAAERAARDAVTHALLRYPMRSKRPPMPTVVYTDPEIAMVGRVMSAASELKLVFPYSELDRAVTDGETTGRIELIAHRRTGRLRGGIVIGRNAGELASYLSLAIATRRTVRQISDVIHPYPTYTLGVRRAADQWYARNYPVRLLRCFGRMRRLQGSVFEQPADRIV